MKHPLTDLARGLTKKYFGNALRVGGYFVYDPGGNAHKRGHPICIIDGYFLDPIYGRLSNHWEWRRVKADGTLGVKKYSGYGGDKKFFRPISKKRAITLAQK
ncbi:MAG: hypothetical protein Q8R36_05415 [bacterium]|nr:hypothetical protein [bacterium]